MVKLSEMAKRWQEMLDREYEMDMEMFKELEEEQKQPRLRVARTTSEGSTRSSERPGE